MYFRNYWASLLLTHPLLNYYIVTNYFNAFTIKIHLICLIEGRISIRIVRDRLIKLLIYNYHDLMINSYLIIIKITLKLSPHVDFLDCWDAPMSIIY